MPSPSLSEGPLVAIVLNKIDCAEELDKDTADSLNEIRLLASRLCSANPRYHLAVTSAKTGKGVRELFDWLVDSITKLDRPQVVVQRLRLAEPGRGGATPGAGSGCGC